MHRFPLILLAAAFLPSSCLFAQPPDTLWTHRYGSEAATWVVPVSNGGYLVAADRFLGGISGPVGPILMRCAYNGAMQWYHAYGSGDPGHSAEVRELSDGSFVMAGTIGEYFSFFLVKTTASGDTLWTRRFELDHEAYCTSFDLTNDGGFILGGWLGVDEEIVNHDIFIIRTDANGVMNWARIYGTDGSGDGINSIRALDDGGFIATGYTDRANGGNPSTIWTLRLNADGDTLWTRRDHPHALAVGEGVTPTEDGGCAVLATTYEQNSTYWEGYVLRLNSAGDTLWTRILLSPGYLGNSIVRLPDNGFITAGHTLFGNVPNVYGGVHLARLSSTGAVLWVKDVAHALPGNTFYRYDWCAQLLPDHGYIVSGGYQSDANTDTYLMRTEPDPTLDIVDVPVALPREFSLSAYPNPFNASTTISFTLPSVSLVAISVYDLTGRRVRTFAEQACGAGEHHVRLDGSALPSGVFFVRLETPDFAATQKLLLLK